MFSKFEYDGKLNPTFVEGPFQLPLSSIRAYLAEPITPRFYYFIMFSLQRLLEGYLCANVVLMNTQICTRGICRGY